LLGEVSGELLVGSGAPGPSKSPSRLLVGIRHPVSREVSLLGTAGVSLSRRTLAGDDLLPIDPRATVGATVLWRFGLPPERGTPPAAAAPPEAATDSTAEATPEAVPEAVPVVATSSVKGTVVDEGGRPLADTEVVLEREGAEPTSTRSFGDGRFEFEDIPEGAVTLLVQTPGFEPARVSLSATDERNQEVVLLPAVPAGQVRGKILDLQGKPIPAQVVLSPGDHIVSADAEGAFDLEIAPGRYTVKFSHADFSTQWRSIRVHDKGV